MKITRIELFPANIPLIEPFRIAIMVTYRSESVFVRIETDEGISGWGEANPTHAIAGETGGTVLAAMKTLAPLLIGKNPLALEERLAEISAFLKHNTTALSAFDMALYDIAAKSANMPLYAFLGGEKRLFWTDNTIGLDEPEKMAEKALRYKERGFQAIKVKLGTTLTNDLKRIEAIRRAIGSDTPIRTDANQGWTARTAIQVLRALGDQNVEYCEQPVSAWNFDALRFVRQKSPIPIMADEALFDHHDAFQLAQKECCDLFNIKLAKSGGIFTALKINAVAEAAGINCMVGCMTESRLGLAAAAHLVSARTNIKYADLDGHWMLKEDPILGGATYKVGEIHLPDEPGIGAEVDPAFLKTLEKLVIK